MKKALVLILVLCMSNIAEAANIVDTPLYPAEITTFDDLLSGYIDEYGRWIILPSHGYSHFQGEPIPNTSNGYLYPVTQDEKQGFMNRDGKWIITAKFGVFPNGLCNRSLLMNLYQ